MRVTIRKALASLPKRKTLTVGRHTHQYTVFMDRDTARNIAVGIREIAKSVKRQTTTPYVRLELPHGDTVVARRYGPVRFVSMYVPLPTDGRGPGMRYRLDVGVA